MLYLILGILLSSSMSVLFKLSERLGINDDNMILINYAVAAFISLLMAIRDGIFQDFFAVLSQANVFYLLTARTMANTYLLLIMLGVISGFYFIIDLVNIKNSIRYNGVGLSALFGKFGFLLTTAFAVVFWKEIPSLMQVGGIALAIVALIIAAGNLKEAGNALRPFLLFQLVLFAGLAEINNKAAVYYAVSEAYNSLYISTIFITALLLAGFYIAHLNKKAKTSFRVSWRDLLGGGCTGLTNVTSSFFILKALETIPANVYFPTSAAGNLIFSTFLSALLFKEALTKRQLYSVVIMIASLILINI